MRLVPHNRRYSPHERSTRVHAVELYRKEHDISYVCRWMRYHLSKASLMRWKKRYDGARESSVDKSHHPHRSHRRAHTEEEPGRIQGLHRRNPNISLNEMYGKLLKKGYQRHPVLLYRVFVRPGYRKKTESGKKNPGAYMTRRQSRA